LLEAEAQASHKAGFLSGLTRRPGVIRCFTEFAGPFHADIRNELAGDLIFDTQTCSAVRQSVADSPAFIVFAMAIQFHAWLEVELLGKPYVVFRFQCQGRTSAGANIGGCIHFKPVRRQSLEAKCQPLPVRRAVSMVESKAKLRIPEC